MTRESQCLHPKLTVRFDVIHKCCVPVFSTEQFELIGGQADQQETSTAGDPDAGRDQLVLIKRNSVQICTKPPNG